MKRRNFLAGTAAAGFAAAAPAVEGGNQFYELRFYKVRNDQTKQRERLIEFLKNEHLPMTRRLGVGPVGYFQVHLGPDMPRIVTLTAYGSDAEIGAKQRAMMEDEKWMKALEEAGRGAPLFDRVQAWLLRAFDGMKKLEVPPEKKGGGAHFFDLRIYESASFDRHYRKVEMFNDGGEIAIFRRCGLNPVFFGQTLFGAKMPNLVYMLWYDDWNAREAAWGKFRNDPDWERIRRDPKYANTVSNITNTFLQPLEFSPIR